jgi:hypothetical protein
LLKEEEEIIRIKHLVYCSNKPEIQIEAIASLKKYGKYAIHAISDIIGLFDIDVQVKIYGLKVIEDIRKGSPIDQP